jgi:hypothetical protein
MATAPATATTSGGGSGNCNRVPTGLGFDVIVPSPGHGAYNVDLTTAVPVPSDTQTGYWDANYETGVITASANPGHAMFNLLTTELHRSTAYKVIFHNQTGAFALPAYGVTWVHPNWVLSCIVNKQSSSAGIISGWVRVFRKISQVP